MKMETPSRTLVASLRTLWPAGVVVSAFLFPAAGSAAAATITVNTLAEASIVDGNCSLREAITAANTNAPVDACSTGVGADTITFSVTGTIVLASTLPAIQDTLAIHGPGAANLVISGNGAVRVFTVNNFVSAVLRDLTVANGNDPLTFAGGAENSGLLTIRACTFTGNRAAVWSGAIRNANRLTVIDSIFSGNGTSGTASGGAITHMGLSATITDSTFSNNLASSGGAIFIWPTAPNASALSVAGSTFSGNTASAGGAIQNRGTMTVERSTFSGNRALTGGGGAILDTGSPSTTTITNTTFSGNSAVDGGAVTNNNSMTMTITHSTFSGNSGLLGGGIATHFAKTTFRNSLFANNTGGNCYLRTGGAIVDGGGNLSYPDTTCPGVNLDPVLAPLASNGGPTQTRALGAGSGAIDAALAASCAATDQRGVLRPFGVGCDIGAYESDNLPPVADAGEDQSAPASAICTAGFTLDGSGSSDPDGNPLTYTWSGPVTASGPNPTVTLPQGVHLITLTVSDGRGGTDTDQVQVTGTDTTSPELSGVPGSIVAECTTSDLTPVTVPLPTAADNCDGPVAVTSNAPADFPLGSSTVLFTALDAASNQATATTSVTVRDATPPAIASLTAAPALLWPPDHTMVPVTVTASASDVCGAATCQVISVAGNEPISDSAGDWQVTGTLTLNLRAERLSSGSGRVYTIAVQCNDAWANASTGTAIVTVPNSSQAIDFLMQKVNDLVAGGRLSSGPAGGLIAKLRAAADSLNNGDRDAAARELTAFINQVNGLVGARKLAPADGQMLIVYALQIIAAL